ncbi:MAG TPA: S-layer homology domain-containing protein [Vicinamibacterales bacterium]|jgi:tetratricopeptide (TPR) repeat protein
MRKSWMRRLAGWLALVGLVVVGACTPKVVPLPAPGPDHYPDFLFPATPSSLTPSPKVADHQQRGWRFLQAGNLDHARSEFSSALSASSSFYPAAVGLGDVALAHKRPKDALDFFGKALAADSRYVPALVGQGQAYLALNQSQPALESFKAALAIDPSLPNLGRQMAVLQFRAQQDTIDQARKAAAAGHADQALQAYSQAIAASPDSAFLYRERAGVERQQGNGAQALADFHKAIALDPNDAAAYEQMAALLDQQGDLNAAAGAWQRAYALNPSPDLKQRMQDAQNRAALAKLPASYRAIDQAPQITRADLAALVGVRLAPFLSTLPQGGPVLITDGRDSWAAPWIQTVARAGIMPPYPNHTFQPRTTVTRGELATVLSRLLRDIGRRTPSLAHQWSAAHRTVRDVPPQHLSYPAVSLVLSAGVMSTEADGSFQLAKPASGAEAIQALDRVSALARRSE